MALSAGAHHSFDKVAGGETYYGPRAQKTGTTLHGDRRKEAELFQLFEEEPDGLRPEAFAEPRPQERVQRHVMEHLTDLVRVAPMVQILDAPVPQMDAFRLLDPPVAEQVGAQDLLLVLSFPCGSPFAADGGPFVESADDSSRLRSRLLTFQFPVVSVMISFQILDPSALPVDLRGEPIQEVFRSVPRHAQYLHKAWKKHQNTVYWVDIYLAIKKGLTFYQTRSNAIILQETLLAYCVPKVVRWRSLIRKSIHVTSASAKHLLETRMEKRIRFRTRSTIRSWAAL